MHSHGMLGIIHRDRVQKVAAEGRGRAGEGEGLMHMEIQLEKMKAVSRGMVAKSAQQWEISDSTRLSIHKRLSLTPTLKKM